MRLTSSPLPRLIAAGICATLALAGAPSGSTPRAQAQAPTDAIDEQVAAALYDRGMVLFERGDVANAKKMFSESLERSGKGSRSADALRMLRQCNEKLGIGDLDAGRPAPADGPLDPYANGSGGEAPLDPYGGAGTGTGGEAPLDPYGDPAAGIGDQKLEPGPGADALGESDKWSRRSLILQGGLQGFFTGMALGGPYEDVDQDGDLDELSGGAVFAGLLLGGGSAYLSHYLSKKLSLTAEESVAIASTSFWMTYNFAHLGNVFAGEDSDGNDIYASMALGGWAGTGLGYWYAKSYQPSAGQTAFTNSMSLYGTSAGLLLGVAMDPPRGDAYSLNAFLGSAAGIGTGLLLGSKVDVSRRRMYKVDLGAAAGAALPWVLVYPLVAEANSDGDVRLTGLLSSLSMGAGAYLAWHLTRDDDAGEDAGEPQPPPGSAAPALLRRGQAGSWALSAPMLRPMDMPQLAPRRGLSLGADLVSGRF